MKLSLQFSVLRGVVSFATSRYLGYEAGSFPACESEGLYLKFPPLPILHKTDLLARIIQIIYIIVTDFDLEKLKETANTGSNRQFDRNVTDPTWPVTPVMSATFFLDVTAFARKPSFCSKKGIVSAVILSKALSSTTATWTNNYFGSDNQVQKPVVGLETRY